MRKLFKQKRWLTGIVAAYVLASCVSQPQLFDFVRTEFARATANTIGQIVLIGLQSIGLFQGAA